jgi:4-amino-4-deoxy-L-arabinose transferase-like glycosyltransferase
VAAHAAVVSEPGRPMAVLSADVPRPQPQSEPTPPPALLARVDVAETTPTLGPAPASMKPSTPLVMSTAAAPASAAPPADIAPPTRHAPPPVLPRANASLPPLRVSDLLWLLLALVVIVGTGLGVRDPWPADEPRFVSLARDMASSGEWLFPRVGGDLYQDKPPFFFWLLALSVAVFGATKVSFLIPSFLAAGGVLFLVYDFGRRTVGREAGFGAAITVLCTLQFVLATRGAQIDPTLCLLTTFAVYAFLRHLLLGDGWRWYLLGGFAAGLGIFTKGVGFLPVLLLIPYFLLRGFGWRGLATLDAGRFGWRWLLAPIAMLLAVSLWLVPMLLAVENAAPEYAAYRDEILFKQTVGRYAAAWHHVKPWYYFLVEVIPALWLPWSLLLIWLVPRFKSAFSERNARVWLPLAWVMLVVLFFSLSPGKRGIYIMPALPVLAMAALPFIQDVFARRGVRLLGYALAIGFFVAALTLAVGHAMKAGFAVKAVSEANLAAPTPLYVYLVLCGLGLAVAFRRIPLLAWPAALGALTITFSYFIAPSMNGERSGADFVRAALAGVKPNEQLGLVAYKEQFLLYLDRPTVNFGHRRWQEGPQEFYDAAAWLNAGPDRVLLVPEEGLVPRNRFDASAPIVPCFVADATPVGVSSEDHWFLVRGPAEADCASRGNAARAIGYPR